MPATINLIRDRAEAEAQVCAAIATLGRLAGIDVDLGDGPEDIDANLIQAAYESNFDDPHFLGGPGCISHAAAPGDVTALADRAGVVTRGLARYIGKRGTEATVQQAHVEVARVDTAFAWLSHQVAGA